MIYKKINLFSTIFIGAVSFFTIAQETINDTVRIKINAIGDIMMHQTQLNAHKQLDGTYDFSDNFRYMKPYFEKADVTIGNLETTFAGQKEGYSSYPRFNTPDELATAIKWSGINLVSTANNHSFDKGGKAMLRTIDVLKENDLKVIGTRKDTLTKPYIVEEVKGIKIGFTSYTYESGKNDAGLKTINGLVVPKEFDPLLNSFDYNDLDVDFKRIKGVVDNMRSDSAEFIVFVIHWGDEYALSPNKKQRDIANRLNEMGVDIVFGGHPHVVQPVEFIKNDSTEQLTFVTYSMGNYVSNQRYESMKNYNTEDGLMVSIDLIKTPEDKRLKIEKVDYEPMWVHRYFVSGKPYYNVIPTEAALLEPNSYNINNKETIIRVKNSRKRTIELVETKLNTHQEALFKTHLIRKQE